MQILRNANLEIFNKYIDFKDVFLVDSIVFPLHNFLLAIWAHLINQLILTLYSECCFSALTMAAPTICWTNDKRLPSGDSNGIDSCIENMQHPEGLNHYDVNRKINSFSWFNYFFLN